MEVKFDKANVLQPDVLYISEQKKPDLVKDMIEGASDLVIEILFPSNAYYDLCKKKDIYETYGVKEYIIVDPVALNCELYVLKDGAYQLDQKKNEMLNSVLLSGLTFDPSKIFNS